MIGSSWLCLFHLLEGGENCTAGDAVGRLSRYKENFLFIYAHEPRSDKYEVMTCITSSGIHTAYPRAVGT